jgi:hypothetical protein
MYLSLNPAKNALVAAEPTEPAAAVVISRKGITTATADINRI